MSHRDYYIESVFSDMKRDVDDRFSTTMGSSLLLDLAGIYNIITHTVILPVDVNSTNAATPRVEQPFIAWRCHH